MRKRSTFWLTAFIGILLTLVAACGPGSQANNSTNTATLPQGESLYILDGYTSQRSITLHPGNHSSQAAMTLPAGLFSQDHQRVYTAISQGRQTAITVTNMLTGAKIRSMTIDGAYRNRAESPALLRRG